MSSLKIVCNGLAQIIQRSNAVRSAPSFALRCKVCDQGYTTSAQVPGKSSTELRSQGGTSYAPTAANFSSAAQVGTASVPKETKSGPKKFELVQDDVLNLSKSDECSLFDVREPEEVKETGLILNAVNLPLSSLKASLEMEPELFQSTFKTTKPTKDDPNVIFYGYCAVKSATALEIAHKLGYKRAKHYPGGWEEWSKSVKK